MCIKKIDDSLRERLLNSDKRFHRFLYWVYIVLLFVIMFASLFIFILVISLEAFYSKPKMNIKKIDEDFRKRTLYTNNWFNKLYYFVVIISIFIASTFMLFFYIYIILMITAKIFHECGCNLF